MADYNFKEWLTVEEAATWLADNAGKAYGAPALYRAIEKGLIQAYYWPGEKVSLGLFTYELAPDAKEELLTPWGASDWRQKGQPLPFLGPVPFSDYGDFLDDATRRPTKTTGIGRLLDQYGGIINGYVYIVGANDEALSLSSIPYHVLVRLDALETFARMTAQACVPPPRILIHDTRQLA
ncbi:MAG TPA: hypothetical protein VL178_02705, partial [Pseudomonas sp.]|nr:hypothetical protein [Pseudomonas sp.]